jgi:hypothetical protein
MTNLIRFIKDRPDLEVSGLFHSREKKITHTDTVRVMTEGVSTNCDFVPFRSHT